MLKLSKVHHKNHHIEPVWHVQVALIIAVLLQFALNHNLSIGPKLIIAELELVLIALLVFIHPNDKPLITRIRRTIAIGLIAIISLANLTSLILVLYDLFHGSLVSGRELILSAMAIYITNIIIFGLWYWELDSDGAQGQSTDIVPIDFLFPQMTVPDSKAAKDWVPTFFDYLYISVTNATAFSPNDVQPLTHRAKLLMSAQAFISLVTIALVVTRAVSILA